MISVILAIILTKESNLHCSRFLIPADQLIFLLILVIRCFRHLSLYAPTVYLPLCTHRVSPSMHPPCISPVCTHRVSPPMHPPCISLSMHPPCISLYAPTVYLTVCTHRVSPRMHTHRVSPRMHPPCISTTLFVHLAYVPISEQTTVSVVTAAKRNSLYCESYTLWSPVFAGPALTAAPDAAVTSTHSAHARSIT